MVMNQVEMDERRVWLTYACSLVPECEPETMEVVPRALLYDTDKRAWVLHVYDLQQKRDRALKMEKIRWA